MSKKVKYHETFAKFLKLAIMSLLLLPFIIQVLKLKEAYPLHGVQFSNAEKYADSLKGSENYFNGSWQQLKSYQIQENLLIRNVSIKIRNQIDFSLFNKVNAQNLYYYGNQFFRFYCVDYHEGILFMGEDEIKEKVQKIKAITYALGDSIPIITAIAPTKSYLYSDLLPEYNTKETEYSNYRYIKKTLLENNMHCIDFNQWFMDINTTSIAPLMGTGGVHWSRYGATIAMDSLINYLNEHTNNDFKKPEWRFVQEEEVPNVNDNDAVYVSNLKCPPFDNELRNIAYYETDSSRKKVKALIVADSFFDVVSYFGLRNNIFTEDSKFDYYYGTQPGIGENQHLEEGIFEEYLTSVDCIIILSDVVNLENYSWGFIDEAYKRLVLEEV